jgi:hypothetical protein
VPTRAAFAPPGRVATPSPPSSLLHGPPTPLALRPSLRFPSLGPTAGHSPPAEDRGLPGCWAVLFLRAAAHHPAGRAAPSPTFAETALLPSGSCTPWASGTRLFQGCTARGPHARCPTHQRPRYRRRCKGSLPACRAQLWPGGFRTRWTTHRISRSVATSFPIGPAYPGRSARPGTDPLGVRYCVPGIPQAGRAFDKR